jgi:alpha-beta hydrolase superfamily lysophospholipase
MGGMVSLRTALCYPKMFQGMVLNGPLIIPGAQFGPVDFRVTSFRAVPVRAVLGLLNWYNPEMILGGVNMDLISRDEEVKRALASDQLRWSSGCKVTVWFRFDKLGWQFEDIYLARKTKWVYFNT